MAVVSSIAWTNTATQSSSNNGFTLTKASGTGWVGGTFTSSPITTAGKTLILTWPYKHNGTTVDRVLGIRDSSASRTDSYTDCLFGYQYDGTSVYFYDNGAYPAATAAASSYSIQIANGTVTWYRDGALVRTSGTAAPASITLVGICYNNGSPNSILITSFDDGSAAASATGGMAALGGLSGLSAIF
jgi:hypothetical protein